MSYFSSRKEQSPAPRRIGDVDVEMATPSGSESALDSLPDVEAAGEIIDIPADNDPIPTPLGPMDTVDIRDTLA